MALNCVIRDNKSEFKHNFFPMCLIARHIRAVSCYR